MSLENRIGIRMNRAACANGTRAALLVAADRYVKYVMYGLYPAALLFMLVTHNGRFLRAVLVPAVSLLAVSFLRAKINRPRPYETGEVEDLIEKSTSGDSMPSRHVFSAAVISMVLGRIHPVLGAAGWLMTALSAFCRVAGGVHYISDTIIGMLAGFLAGLLI